MSKTLALDLSTKSTGWAVFEDNKLIGYGLITASSTDVINRIYKINKGLKEVLKTYTDITKVVIEEVRPEDSGTGVGNQHTQKVLLWLQASIAFLLHDDFEKAEIVYTYPNEWRKACGIKVGRGIKRQTLKQADIDFVQSNYGIKVNDDIADAVCIGHAYINHLDNEINWE